MENILCISSRLHPGVSSVFINMQKVGLCTHLYLEDIPEPDDFSEWKLVILGAWVNEYNERIKKIRITSKVGILITSSIGQIEQTNYMELQQLQEILNHLDNKLIDFVFVGCKNLYEVLKQDKIKFFPYPIYIHSEEQHDI